MSKPRFSSRASNITARLTLDPKSLREFDAALKRLESAVRKEAVIAALQKGGEVIGDAAAAKAPGPYIVTMVMTGAELARGWKSAGKQGVKPEGLYAVIGPDAQHWYYRFAEYGVKGHGVSKRKRTRYQQFASKNKMKRSTLTSYTTGKARNVSGTRPVMAWMSGGKMIFARKVSGFPAKPFLRPAVDSKGDAAIKVLGVELGKEIMKAARA
jgi:HK97 gp10 family phage protein